MSRRLAGLCLLISAFLLVAGVVMYRVKTRSEPPRHYTETDVRDFVVSGVTRRDEILARFGKPIFVETHPKYEDGVAREDEILHFSVDPPPGAVNGRYGFAGFDVGIKGGLATDVHFSTGTVYKQR